MKSTGTPAVVGNKHPFQSCDCCWACLCSVPAWTCSIERTHSRKWPHACQPWSWRKGVMRENSHPIPADWSPRNTDVCDRKKTPEGSWDRVLLQGARRSWPSHSSGRRPQRPYRQTAQETQAETDLMGVFSVTGGRDSTVVHLTVESVQWLVSSLENRVASFTNTATAFRINVMKSWMWMKFRAQRSLLLGRIRHHTPPLFYFTEMTQNCPLGWKCGVGQGKKRSSNAHSDPRISEPRS